MKEVLEAAERDYKTICRLWDAINEEWAIVTIMFHAQQAIEKLLKVIIVYERGIHATITSVSELIRMCNSKYLPKDLIGLADTITTWEVAGYGKAPLVDSNVLSKCLGIYDSLHKTAKSLIREEK